MELVPTASTVNDDTNAHNKNIINSIPDESDRNSRRTASQASDHRKDNKSRKIQRELAYHLATVAVSLYNKYREAAFPSALEAVSRVNVMVGASEDDVFVTSSEICTAVNQGRINQPPPQQGRPSTLSTEIRQAFCNLFFSHAAISQQNSDQSLNRPEYINLLQHILNPYFEIRSLTPLDAVTFFEYIEEENSYRQAINYRDPRDLLRHEWFRSSNLEIHYRNFENFLVEKGFAIPATPEQLHERRDLVYWIEEMRSRAFNGDEMGFGLGDGDNGKGGREPVIFQCFDFNNVGEAAQKSSLKITLFCAMTYSDEALPFLLILPSSSTNPKLPEVLLRSMPQIVGKFGRNFVGHYDCMIEASEKGGMNSRIFEKYIKYIIKILYPGAADELGTFVCEYSVYFLSFSQSHTNIQIY